MTWKPEWVEFGQKIMDSGGTQAAVADGINAQFPGAGVTRSGVAGQITRGKLVPSETWKANAPARRGRGRRRANEIRREQGLERRALPERSSFRKRQSKQQHMRRAARRAGLAQVYLLPKTYVEFDEPQTDQGKTFLDLGNHDCRWWIGCDAEGATRFCGCPVRVGVFYCEGHYAKSVLVEREDDLRREVNEALAVA